MPASPGKAGLPEGAGTDTDDSRRFPVGHAAAQERTTDETERRHEESAQIPERVDYQQWIESQHEELQQGEAGGSSGHGSSGGRRSPRDPDNREGSPRDPESSSLSALSNFSTGLSVSSNLRFRSFLSSAADRISRSIRMRIPLWGTWARRKLRSQNGHSVRFANPVMPLQPVNLVGAIEYIRVRRGTWTDVPQV